MTEDIHPHDPTEGEYTDAELPLDAQLPKEATRGDADLDDDDVVVEEVEVESIEYVDPDRPDRRQR